MNLFTVDSNDTLTNGPDIDTMSLLTSASQETLTNQIFGVPRPISDYTLYNLPMISNAYSQDVQVFGNDTLLSAYLSGDNTVHPVLSTSSSILNYFKLNSPFLSINRFSGGEKIPFCKSYFKLLARNLSCYVLLFDIGGEKKCCLLLNDELKPHVDVLWENTKLRIIGTSGATSTFGNGLIKMFVLTNDYNTLADDIDIQYKVEDPVSPRDISITLPKHNEMLNQLLSQNKSYVSKNLTNSTALINVPLGTFINDNRKSKKHVRNGYLKIFDYDSSLSDNALVTLSILLVLREQETRKNRGNNKPTYM